ncbi:MAG: hypothetical protein IPP50_19990 [Piscinibacter sp.]|nr:hypothetical protein [Piscinibacter sp.]
MRAYKAPTNTDTIGFAGVHARMARQVALAHSGHAAEHEALKRPERFSMGDAHAPAAQRGRQRGHSPAPRLERAATAPDAVFGRSLLRLASAYAESGEREP